MLDLELCLCNCNCQSRSSVNRSLRKFWDATSLPKTRHNSIKILKDGAKRTLYANNAWGKRSFREAIGCERYAGHERSRG